MEKELEIQAVIGFKGVHSFPSIRVPNLVLSRKRVPRLAASPRQRAPFVPAGLNHHRQTHHFQDPDLPARPRQPNLNPDGFPLGEIRRLRPKNLHGLPSLFPFFPNFPLKSLLDRPTSSSGTSQSAR